MQRLVKPLISLSTVIVLGACLGGCSTTAPPTAPSRPAPSRPAPPGPGHGISRPPTSAMPTGPVSPAGCGGGWRRTAVLVVRRVSVPPVPVATAIRTGSHPDCRFDRLVIDIHGALPGYLATFVTKVVTDPSGKAITLPGARYLLIRFTPAQAHTDNATATISPLSRSLSDPMLRGYAICGDFEGVLSIALGLAGRTRYRIGQLAGRLYIDVAW